MTARVIKNFIRKKEGIGGSQACRGREQRESSGGGGNTEKKCGGPHPAF